MNEKMRGRGRKGGSLGREGERMEEEKEREGVREDMLTTHL